jgi:hypothetical protein
LSIRLGHWRIYGMMNFEVTIFQDKEVVSGVPLKFLLKIRGLRTASAFISNTTYCVVFNDDIPYFG